MRRRVTLVIGGFLALGLLSCARVAEDVAVTYERESIELAYVEWACAIASSNMAKAVLQEKLGHEVVLTPVSASEMWDGTAAGDFDGFVCAWLPETHAEYFQLTAGNVVDLGPQVYGASIGLVVPEYVEIDSIEVLPEYAEEFDGQIIGIDPESGIMSATEEAIEVYGLEDFELIPGSDADMVAAIDEAVTNEEWIVVTGWLPHWKFGEWELKELEDPQLVYGGIEAIHNIVRAGLIEDAPETFGFLDRFFWHMDGLNDLMARIEAGEEDPYETAVRWMNENPDVVDQWLQ